MPAQLKNGVQGAPGGAREGAGRPSLDLMSYCRGVIDKYNLIERLILIACNSDPNNNPYPPEVQLKAMIHLLDRGYGKAAQTIEHKGDITMTHKRIVCNYPKPIPLQVSA